MRGYKVRRFRIRCQQSWHLSRQPTKWASAPMAASAPKPPTYYPLFKYKKPQFVVFSIEKYIFKLDKVIKFIWTKLFSLPG